MMTKNKKPALAARAGRNARGQANVSTRHFTTRDELRQLAARAAQNARRCEQDAKKRKFEKIARFLRIEANRGRYEQ